MKLLVIGDFHGEFPKKFEKIIEKEKIDLVVSNGDFSPFLMRKLFFKHCFAKEVRKGLWEFIGKKKYKEMQQKDTNIVFRVFDKLNSLSIPVLTVFGNVDSIKGTQDTFDRDHERFRYENKWDWANQDFYSEYLKKCENIRRIEYNPIKIGDYIFVGMSGHSFPGDKKSKTFKKSKKKLDEIFKKYRKENKNKKVVFVSHNIAYRTLDKITSKKSNKIVKNQHYGSYLARYVIDKYHPRLHIGGHIHEGRGIKKVKNTLVLNPGSIHEGQGAIVEIINKRIKIKLIK